MAKKLTEKEMDAFIKAHKKAFGTTRILDVLISWLLVKGVQLTIILGVVALIKLLVVYLFL